MGYLTISTNVRRYQTHHRWNFFFQEDSALVHIHSACNTVQRCSALDFLSPELYPQQPRALITRFSESSSVTTSPESKRLKKSRSDELNSGNALIRHSSKKMRFLCFHILPGSVEAQANWGGIVKRLLIAYFIGNISAEKYQNAFTYIKVIANQRWDVFLTHSVQSVIYILTRRKTRWNL